MHVRDPGPVIAAIAVTLAGWAAFMLAPLWRGCSLQSGHALCLSGTGQIAQALDAQFASGCTAVGYLWTAWWAGLILITAMAVTALITRRHAS